MEKIGLPVTVLFSGGPADGQEWVFPLGERVFYEMFCNEGTGLYGYERHAYEWFGSETEDGRFIYDHVGLVRKHEGD